MVWVPVGDRYPEALGRSTNRAKTVTRPDHEDVAGSRTQGGAEFCNPDEKPNAVFVDEFEPYALLPLGDLVKGGLGARTTVFWPVLVGVIPLALSFLQSTLGWGFGVSAWLLSAFFCLVWALFLGMLLEPAPRLWRWGVWVAVFTACVGIPLLLVWEHVPVIAMFYSGSQSLSMVTRIAGCVLGVGLFEETCKAIPLMVLSLRERGTTEPGAFVFLGAMSGLGFAWNEGVQYSLQYWHSSAGVSTALVTNCLSDADTFVGISDATEASSRLQPLLSSLMTQYADTLVTQLVRFMTLPLLHAAWSGIVGYFVAQAVLQSQWRYALLGISVAGTLHGAYNVYAGGVNSIGIAVLSIFVFLSYAVHLRRRLGQST